MNIRDKIKGQQPKEMTENEVVVLHELMMSEYGWIPLEEFMNLPLPTFWNILKCLENRKKLEAREYEKIKHKR